MRPGVELTSSTTADTWSIWSGYRLLDLGLVWGDWSTRAGLRLSARGSSDSRGVDTGHGSDCTGYRDRLGAGEKMTQSYIAVKCGSSRAHLHHLMSLRRGDVSFTAEPTHAHSSQLGLRLRDTGQGSQRRPRKDYRKPLAGTDQR
ncbi:hypothetical protein RRG08_013475 [Elysia crispata]|uniref:Uncharacterized protein n=1 Tax=Elysia crispata TaxID=231223 RepID=A0AAE0ZXT4_9GAST|nr:hypothetical protein RRG08_013475 [Elysia crispata]